MPMEAAPLFLEPAACYTLTTDVAPPGSGSVQADPEPNCPTDPGLYQEGTEVQLSANPNTGFSFGGWSGDLTGSTNPDVITIDGEKTVTANFIDNVMLVSPSGTLTSWDRYLRWMGIASAVFNPYSGPNSSTMRRS